MIYPLSSTGLRPAIVLPTEINIRDLLRGIEELRKFYEIIRVSESGRVLYELDLRACETYIHDTCPPESHPFQQLINGLKIQPRQDKWRSCIRDSTGQFLLKENLCDALLAWDDLAPWVTYSLSPNPDYPYKSPNNETVLYQDNHIHRKVIIIAAQLSRIIGRKLELQFYDNLKKALANPVISSKLVLDVGRTLMSLRRRLALWTQRRASMPFPTQFEGEMYVDRDSAYGSSALGNPVERIKTLCQTLYVYFCYMRRRLPEGEQKLIRTITTWYPESRQYVKENFPQYESIPGFQEWLEFRDQRITSMDLDTDM